MKIGTGCLFVLLGLIAGFVLTAVLGLLLTPTKPADSGGREMFVFFGLAPLGALVGAIAGIVAAMLRKDRNPPS
jgi:cytosine/uracil/thiamine/allantoin permease